MCPPDSVNRLGMPSPARTSATRWPPCLGLSDMGSTPGRGGRPGEDRAERRGLLAVEVGDVRDVALRFKVGESRDLRLQAHRETPEAVLPDLDPVELLVAIPTPAEQAVRLRAHRAR